MRSARIQFNARWAAALTALSMAGSLAACGGGGGGTNPLPVMNPNPVTDPQEPATATPSPTGTGTTPRPSGSPGATAQPGATPGPTLRPGASPTPTIRPGASPTPTIRPGASPTPTIRPSASPTPTIRPATTPTPIIQPMPVPTAGVVTPSNAFTWTLSAEKSVSSATPGGAMDAGSRGNFPDAHFSVVPDIGSGYLMYWGIGGGWRSHGPTQYPEDQSGTTLTLVTNLAANKVASDPWQWASAVNWFVSVNRIAGSQKLVAFLYGDDNSTGTYFQNTGVSISNDNGVTWGAGTRLFSPPGTSSPAGNPNTGPGDENGIVIWDFKKNRWFAITPEWTDATGTRAGIMRAESTDPNAAPGTWRKYYNGAYTSPALGGQASLLSIEGMWNPTLFWDTYLGEWVYISDDIQGRLYIMTSKTLDDWTSSQRVFLADSNHWYQYPTAIGVDDKSAGRTFNLYYANFTGYPAGRSLRYVTVTFNRSD